MSDQRIFGFHLRVFPETDVTPPLLSADESVWRNATGDASTGKAFFTNKPVREEDSANGLNVWNLRADAPFEELLSERATGVLVGFSVADEIYLDFAARHGLETSLSCCDPDFQKNWVCLGYDLTDAWMNSGVHAMYPAGMSRDEFRAYLRDAMNAFGLFRSSDLAGSFAHSFAELYVPHGPFYPIGLWGRRQQVKRLWPHL